MSLLFVDDDVLVLGAVRRALAAADIVAVTIASDPRAALVLCRTTRFDVVVSDFKMPGMNGVDLLREVGVVLSSARRVLMTGDRHTRAVTEALLDGTVQLVIDKPFEEETLLRALRGA